VELETRLGRLIERLARHWLNWGEREDYYLRTLAPRLVRDQSQGDDTEREIVRLLREELGSENLHKVPVYLADYRREMKERATETPEQRRARKGRERIAQDAQIRGERRTDEKRNAAIQDRVRRQALEEAERMRAAQEARSLREGEDARKREKKEALGLRVVSWFESSFLLADGLFHGDIDRELLSQTEYRELKTRFVYQWVKREFGQEHRLDNEQAQAVAATGGDILVVARAGSGKTHTLVTRAAFLQKHCRVRSNELLLLAFNNKAAREMRDRLHDLLDGDVPHVMTFHALANALVHPEEQLIFDDDETGNLGLSREIQRVIDEHLQSGVFESLIRDLMLRYFRDDWEQIVGGGFHLTSEELIAYRRSLPRETLKGDYVKSGR